MSVLTLDLIKNSGPKHQQHQLRTWHPESSKSVRTSYWTSNTFNFVPFPLFPQISGPLFHLKKKALCTSVQEPSNTASVHSSRSSPKFLNQLFSRFSQGCCHPCCLCTIPTTFLPWSQLSTNKLQHSTLQQPAFSSVPSCGLPSLWMMSMIIIWRTVKSAVGLCLHVLN